MTEYVAKEGCDLISVIIPAYNDGDNIHNCLDCVLNQTYKNLEIIIVYLESPDNTLEVINSFDDNRIKIVEQKEKTGPGGARNIGLDAATGEYIGFVETDDRIPLNYFETMYKAARESGADITTSEVIQIKNGKERLYSKAPRNRIIKGLLPKLRTMRHGTTFDKLYRAKLIKEHNLRFTSKWRFEDNPWLLKAIYYANCIRQVKGLFYRYFIEDYTEEYANFLKESVPHIAKEMYDFAKEKNFNCLERHQVKFIIIKSFAGYRLADNNVYKSLKQVIGGGLWLEFRRFKALKREAKKKIGEILCQKKS